MLVPQLRFSGFSDSWLPKMIGDVGENIIGLTYSPKDITNDENYPIVLRSSNVQDNALMLEDIVRVKTAIPERLYVRENDILICTRNGSKRLIGKNVLLPKLDQPTSFGAFMSVFRSPINKFVSQLFCTEEFNRQIQVNLGATINQITTGNLNAFQFNFPSEAEQEKIAEFLSAIDQKVANFTKSHELLISYKKGVMQRVFSKEMRFKSDAGEEFPSWSKVKLADIAEIIMGQSPSSSSYNQNGDGSLLIQGNADLKDRKTMPRNWTTEKTKECRIGDIILTVRAPVGAVAMSMHDGCIGRGVCVVRTNTNCLTSYLFQLLTWYEDFKWKSLEQGSTFTAVSGTEIKSIEVALPSIEEQTKIASMLSGIDNKIANVKEQLEFTKQFKQGLLQQMFV